MAEAVARHLERLGGMVVTPRATLERLLRGDEGRLGAILLWLLVLGVALEPERVGRGLLVARVDVFGGVVLLLDALTRRLAIPLAGVIGAAALLGLAARARGGRLPLDRALDVAGFLLAPFLLLAAIGATLAALGVDLWFLPHRPWRGPPPEVGVRAAVGFGPSLALLVLAFRAARPPAGSS